MLNKDVQLTSATGSRQIIQKSTLLFRAFLNIVYLFIFTFSNFAIFSIIVDYFPIMVHLFQFWNSLFNSDTLVSIMVHLF